ncbi:MAG: hypothetical protein Q7R74_00680, partial [bacterium]|nr:hypothetical protein [bacterium]
GMCSIAKSDGDEDTALVFPTLIEFTIPRFTGSMVKTFPSQDGKVARSFSEGISGVTRLSALKPGLHGEGGGVGVGSVCGSGAAGVLEVAGDVSEEELPEEVPGAPSGAEGVAADGGELCCGFADDPLATGGFSLGAVAPESSLGTTCSLGTT